MRSIFLSAFVLGLFLYCQLAQAASMTSASYQLRDSAATAGAANLSSTIYQLSGALRSDDGAAGYGTLYTVLHPVTGTFNDTTAPVVSAGANQTKRAAFTQTATATDDNAMTYAWSKQSGLGGITFGTSTSLSTTISADTDGTYVLRFTATDSFNNSAYSDMTLTWDTTAPAVSAGANQAKKSIFTQTATAADANSMIYAWSKQSGPGLITFGTSTALSTTISADTDGTYVLRFAATDIAGNSAYSDMTLTWDTTAPTISIGSPSSVLTKNSDITYTVTYSGADSVTLADANIILNNTGTANGIATVSGTGTTTRIVTISSITGDGTLGISITANTASDTAGNSVSASGASAIFNVDNTAPVISATSPASGSFINHGQAAYTLSEAIVSGSITFTRIGGTADASSPRTYALSGPDMTPGSHTVQNIALQNGTIYTVTFDATDAAGNSAGQVISSSVTYDTTGATATITAPSSGSRTNTASVIYTVNETIGIGTITFTRTSGTADSSSPHTYQLAGGELSSGSHNVNTGKTLVDGATYTVSLGGITDLAGNNTSTVSNTDILFDTTSVSITAVSPATSGILNAASVGYTLSEAAQSGSISFTRTGGTSDTSSPHTYSMQAADLTTGVHNVATSLPLLNDTIYTLSITATDLTGNPATTISYANVTYSDRHLLSVARSGTGTGTITATAGTGSGINCGQICGETYLHNASVTLTATPDTGSVFTGWTVVCTGTGTCTVTMDAAKSVTAIFSDAIPPNLSVSPIGGTFANAQAVTLTSDKPNVTIYYTTTGIAPTTSSTKYIAPLAITKTTTVMYVGYDAAGNRSAVGSQTYIIAHINGTCGISNSGAFTIAPTTNLCTTGTASAITGTGPWSWTCTGTNGGATANCIASIDVTGPTLSLSTLADGAITNNATLNIAGTVSDTIEVASLKINNTTVTITDGTFSHAVTMQAGTNTITTVATDILGNTTTDTRSITLDITAPTLTVSAPADNSKTAQSLATITGTISETSTVTVALNTGTPQNASITGNNYSAAITLVSGLNSITIKATDLAGNTTSTVRTVTYDNSNPSLAITYPSQDVTVNQNSITINGTVSDTMTAATVSINFNSQTYIPAVSGGTFLQQLTIPSEGTFAITVKATDEAGNSSSATRNIIYVAPTNGVCGTTNGIAVTSAPTENLCTIGSASAVTGTGPWNWSCAGTNSGTTATCSSDIHAYTVTFAAALGGNLTGTANQTINHGSNTTEVIAVPLAGYHFVNWTGTGGFAASTTNPLTVSNVSAAQTITANFSINNYNVSFNNNGGSAVTNQSVTYNTVATSPTTPTKTGSTFGGWYSDAALTTTFAFTTPITVDTTLYAKWTINNYTVSFNSNGGSSVTSQNVAYNTTVTSPTTPTKTGYSFGGWYSDAAQTTAFAFTTLITADTALFAKWTTNNYTVSFNSNGGSTVTSQNVAYNTSATTPTTPTKTGSTFGGWYSDAALTSAFAFTTPITADTTLFAKWTTNNYTVSFNSNGGSAVTNQSVTYKSAATAPTAPTKAGFTFEGWYSDAALTTAFAFTTPITADTTLFAKWTTNNYTVTFNSNGGSAVTNQSVTYNTVATSPTTPTKTGYSFGGWYSDGGLSAQFSFSTPISGDTILYAKWTINSLTVSFNVNGGSAVPSQTVAYNTVAAQPTAPTRSGYTFAGWYSDSSLTKAYSFSTAITESISLYARWTQLILKPSAPGSVQAIAGDTRATVTFAEPANDGGSIITYYTVSSTPGGITASGKASPITVAGLSNGTSYTFTVTATNSIGTSLPSMPSNAVTPTDSTAPVVTMFVIPAALTAADTSTSVSVPITALQASDNVAVTGYQVTTISAKPTSGWSSSVPASIDIPSTPGIHTLFAWAIDAAGNVSSSYSTQTLVTPVDTTPPVIISGPTVTTIRDTYVVVEWQTNEAANGYLNFGTSYPLSNTLAETGYSLSHSMTINGLIPGAQYHAAVAAKDTSGNGTTLGKDITFTTASAKDITPPSFTDRPTIISISQDSATVQWRTNEPSLGTIYFGTVTILGQNVTETEYKTDHSVKLTGLVPSTGYYLKVSATDSNSNGPSESSIVTFTTTALPDTKAPTIVEGPMVTNITNNSATVIWKTDEPSTSEVVADISGSNYSVTANNTLTTNHSVLLTGLNPSTQYNYRVASSDSSGNITQLNTKKFTTTAAPDTNPPMFTEGPMIITITEKSAVIRWTTDEPADGAIEYGTTQTLGTVESRTSMVTNHNIPLTGLEPGATYYFRVRSTDSFRNGPTTSRIYTFTTNRHAVFKIPVITKAPTVVYKSNSAMTIIWETDEPCDSVVEYSSNAMTNRVAIAELVTVHQVTVSNLLPNTSYKVVVSSTNASGNTTVADSGRKVTYLASNLTGSTSDALIGDGSAFATTSTADTTPPLITSGPFATGISDTQAVITWTTDEIADSQVSYGLSGGSLGLSAGSIEQRINHTVVLTNLAPNTAYDFVVESTDPSRNGPSLGSRLTFTTTSSPDLTPPVITGLVRTAVIGDKNTFNWSTDKFATTQLRSGLNTAMTSQASAPGLSLDHELTIVLQPGTTYYVAAVAMDNSGNSSESGIISFTTAGVADVTAPTTTASLGNGSYIDAQNVTLTADKPANIYYTTNGSEPTTSSQLYNSPINVTSSKSLKFFALDGAGNKELAKSVDLTIQYLVIGSTSDDNGTLTCPGLVNSNETAICNVTANAGYKVKTISGCGGELNGTSYTTAPISGNCTVNAVFSPVTFTVSFDSNGGTAINSQSISYNGNATQTPNPSKTGYTFGGWYSDSALTSSFSFTTPITSDTVLYAKWNANNFTLTFQPGASGSLSGTIHQSVIYNGSSSQVTAIPASGFNFVSWTGNNGFVTRTENPLVVNNVTADYTITANFAAPTYTVTPVTGSGFSIFPENVQTVVYGNTATFTVNPTAGYGILSVSGCNGTLNSSSYTTANITDNCSITVTTVKRNGNGTSSTTPNIADALKALQAYAGLITLSPSEKIIFDVAPLSSAGVPQGNNLIDAADVILILRRSVGIGNW